MAVELFAVHEPMVTRTQEVNVPRELVGGVDDVAVAPPIGFVVVPLEPFDQR